MKIIWFAVVSCLGAIAAPAAAQSIPDDVRCLVLSNGFAKGATEEPARQAAAQAMLFFLGRLDARGDALAVGNAMRAQVGKIDPKTAATEMNTCAARVSHAAQTMEALGGTAAPGK